MSQMQLLREKRFRPLFWTQFFGAFNDNFFKNALVILITYRTTEVLGIPSSQMVAAAGGIFILPFFLFSATAGQIADRYEKGQIIRWIKLVEILVMIMAGVGFVFHLYGFLLFSLFLMGLHSTFFGPIKFSILPQHLSESELVGANALVEAGTFLAILLGTLGGGVLISLPRGGPELVSICLLLIAVLGYLASRSIPEAKPVDPGVKVQWNPITPTWQIFRFVRENRAVYLSVLGISWFWFFGSAMLSLFPPYCKDVLKVGEGVVTLFLATFSIGIAIGSLLCERLSRNTLELGLVPFGSIGLSVFALDLFFMGTPDWASQKWRILADLLLLSIFAGFYIVPLNTMVQERSAPSHRSRIVAGNNILNAFFMVIASLMLMKMMSWGFSIPQMFMLIAVLNGLVALYIYTLLPEFLMRFMIWIVANIMYRLRVSGQEKVPLTGPALLVCNHVSFVDWMIISAAVPRPIRFVMDHRFMGPGIFGMLMRQAKVIPIATAKENEEILKAAFIKVSEELKNGEMVCIFPEGKITAHGMMNPFKPGVERILAADPVRVVPMALIGLWGSFFSREGGRAVLKMPRRFWSRVTLRIGEPVAAESAKADMLFDRVKGLFEQETKPTPPVLC